ncbi:MAG TPA: AmmeMemoRadiSam system protein A, partial [Candidatus Polarisedimenticolia bacterium]|nr:AmmeMemoRadiSam system protein A [Candidatus Polarisedimenticolia bacterium]
ASVSDPLRHLSRDERRALLALARRAVQACLAALPGPEVGSQPTRLRMRQDAFVTLRVRRELRGCIGIMEGADSLAETVIRCAAAAATEDPRFTPLDPAELPDLSIEVSALRPPVRVPDPSRIVLGRDGLRVTRGGRRGVLLPQVAVEQGWDLETFVRECCLKAGLPPDAVQQGATLEAFSAEVFSEDEEEATRPRPGFPRRSPAPS